MTRKLKPVHIEVPEEIREAILNLPVPNEAGDLETLGTLLNRARETLSLINRTLSDNALVQFTADQLMRAEKKRGDSTILAHLDGTVSLHISYEGSGVNLDIDPSPLKSKLPTLDELRLQAAALDVDISDLGRAKLRIIERLADPPSR